MSTTNREVCGLSRMICYNLLAGKNKGLAQTGFTLVISPKYEVLFFFKSKTLGGNKIPKDLHG